MADFWAAALVEAGLQKGLFLQPERAAASPQHPSAQPAAAALAAADPFEPRAAAQAASRLSRGRGAARASGARGGGGDGGGSAASVSVGDLLGSLEGLAPQVAGAAAELDEELEELRGTTARVSLSGAEPCDEAGELCREEFCREERSSCDAAGEAGGADGAAVRLLSRGGEGAVLFGKRLSAEDLFDLRAAGPPAVSPPPAVAPLVEQSPPSQRLAAAAPAPPSLLDDLVGDVPGTAAVIEPAVKGTAGASPGNSVAALLAEFEPAVDPAVAAVWEAARAAKAAEGDDPFGLLAASGSRSATGRASAGVGALAEGLPLAPAAASEAEAATHPEAAATEATIDEAPYREGELDGPSVPYAEGCGVGGVLVEWQTPPWADTGAISHFELQWRCEPASPAEGGTSSRSPSWLRCAATRRLAVRRVVASGLPAGTAVWTRVRAIAHDGRRSGWSDAICPALTAPQPPEAFPAPQGVVNLVLDPVPCADSYELQWRVEPVDEPSSAASAGWEGNASSAALRATTVTKRNLPVGESFQFRYRAVSVGGASPFSAPSEPVLVGEPQRHFERLEERRRLRGEVNGSQPAPAPVEDSDLLGLGLGGTPPLAASPPQPPQEGRPPGEERSAAPPPTRANGDPPLSLSAAAAASPAEFERQWVGLPIADAWRDAEADAVPEELPARLAARHIKTMARGELDGEAKFFLYAAEDCAGDTLLLVELLLGRSTGRARATIKGGSSPLRARLLSEEIRLILCARST